MKAADKKLNEMNRLSDMAHFPPLVNLGASVNVLLTITLTWLLVPRFPQTAAPMLWLALVLFLSLLPVLLLRLTLRPDTAYPTLRAMDFVHDQHKFSDWVYVAASANMAFWVLSAWALFSWGRSVQTLAALILLALLCTFSPVLWRSRQS